MSSWAKPGVKCVCVDADPDKGRCWHGTAPVVGRTYTIVRIKGFGYDGSPVAIFGGINNGAPVRIARFRPLVTKTQEQDIAMFKAMLAPTPHIGSNRQRETTPSD